ncbi:MAG: glycosyltransferase family 1 protein [bacterium]
MKIGVDIRSLMEQQYSGVAEYTLNLLRALLEIDKKNQYLFFYNSLRKVSLPEFKQKNVKLCGFRYPNKLFNLGLKISDRWQLDKMLGGVDVFWLPNPQFANLSDKCQKVITFHDLSFERFPEFFSFKRRRWHELVNFKKLARQASRIIAVSESTKRDLMEFYKINPPAGGKINVIHSGLNDLFNQEIISKEKVKERYNLPDRFILYLSTLEPRKNVIGLIDAFNLIKSQTKLILAGGEGWLYGDIYRAVANSPKKGYIKFLGYVADEDRPALYSLAELFVFPSFYEGFGFPVLEAMACGTPVITSANSSLPEISGGAAILINPYNVGELASAIDQVLLSDELKNRLKEKGREQARKFRWDETARETLAVFENII